MTARRLAPLSLVIFAGACLFGPSAEKFEEGVGEQFCGVSEGFATCLQMEAECDASAVTDIVNAAAEGCDYDQASADTCLDGLIDLVKAIDCNDQSTLVPVIPEECDDVYTGDDCTFDLNAIVAQLAEG